MRFFVPTIDWDDQRNMLACRFSYGVAKQPAVSCVRCLRLPKISSQRMYGVFPGTNMAKA
jgi:hypothetical protein